MKKRENLINKKFGKITVTKISDKKKNRGFLWECLCDCGNICYDTTQNLKTNHRLSCGCNKKENIDLTGLKVGMLTVLSYKGIKSYDKTHSERRWYCKCECGNYIDVSTSILNKNKIKSCGCVHGNKAQKHHGWQGYGDISGAFWYQIQSCAKVRNLEFNISIEYIWNLYLLQDKKCKLSNIIIPFGDKNLKIKPIASLDRIDSTKGYIEGNVQWVHKDINKMKSNFDEKYFIEIVIKIANNNNNNKKDKKCLK